MPPVDQEMLLSLSCSSWHLVASWACIQRGESSATLQQASLPQTQTQSRTYYDSNYIDKVSQGGSPNLPTIMSGCFLWKDKHLQISSQLHAISPSLIHPLSDGASQFKADSGLFKSANRENCLPLSHIKLSGAGPLD